MHVSVVVARLDGAILSQLAYANEKSHQANSAGATIFEISVLVYHPRGQRLFDKGYGGGRYHPDPIRAASC